LTFVQCKVWRRPTAGGGGAALQLLETSDESASRKEIGLPENNDATN